MCTVVEICSTGVRVTLSDVPEVLLTATNSESPVQDAGLAAMAGTYSNGIGQSSGAVFLCALVCLVAVVVILPSTLTFIRFICAIG